MDPNYQGAQPSVIAELVAYIVKPEAYFMSGKYVVSLRKMMHANVLFSGQAINMDGGLIFD